MEREATALAGAAAWMMAAAVGTEAWGAVRARIEKFCQRALGIDVGPELIEAGEMLHQPRLREIALAHWTSRLAGNLHAAPGASDELRALIAGFYGGQADDARVAPFADYPDFRDGAFHGPVVGVQHNYGATQGGGVAAPDDWPALDAVDPIGLGVHRTHLFGGVSELPPYVDRDVDGQLVELLRRVRGGGLVVVTGRPLSGKSRTAAAALSAALPPETRVYAPSPGMDLRGIPAALRSRNGSYVLWLDELEGHLGEQGLESGLLTRLIDSRVLVLGTMREETYDAHRFGSGPAARVLRRAAIVELASQWSDSELGRLARCANDVRLAEALEECGDRSPGEYLALGPELWDEWRRASRADAHPRGHVLVRAAVDLARCGLTGPLPVESLRSVHEEYESDVPKADWERFDEALAWATAPRLGVAGLLIPGEGETVRAPSSLIADARRSNPPPLMPDGIWYVALALDGVATDRDTLQAEGDGALLPRAEGGDAEAMFLAGALGHRTEGLCDAVLRRYRSALDAEGDWFRELAGAGRTQALARAAEAFAAQGRYEEAIRYAQAACAADDPDGRRLIPPLQHEMHSWERTALFFSDFPWTDS
ncbi:hypothetical protein [Streptomyces sp. NPDC003635]